MRRALVALAVLAVAACRPSIEGERAVAPDGGAAPATAVAVTADALTTTPVDTGVLTIFSRLPSEQGDIDAAPSDALLLGGCELVTDDTLVVWGELEGDAAPQRVQVEVEVLAGDHRWSRALEGHLSGPGSLAVPLVLDADEQALVRAMARAGGSCHLALAAEALGGLASEPLDLAVAASVPTSAGPTAPAARPTE